MRTQIAAEIKWVQSEIDQQKRLIKNNIAKKLMAETAEQHCLSVPEATLRKKLLRTRVSTLV